MGYITGAVLFVLGLVLIFLNYMDRINMTYFVEFWRLFGIYVGYIVVLTSTLLIVRYTTKVPDYIFRKLLHIVAFTSILPLVLGTDIWWISVLAQAVLLVIVIILLHIATGKRSAVSRQYTGMR